MALKDAVHLQGFVEFLAESYDYVTSVVSLSQVAQVAGSSFVVWVSIRFPQTTGGFGVDGQIDCVVRDLQPLLPSIG
jgi:hypothetical protein